MPIDFIDETGSALTVRDYETAIDAVTQAMVGSMMLKVPPMLAVELGNVRRCLQQGMALTKVAEEAARRKA